MTTPRWIRICCEIYPVSRVAEIRAHSDGGVLVFAPDGTNLAECDTTTDDIGEHATLREAMDAASAWERALEFRNGLSEIECGISLPSDADPSRPGPHGDRPR